MLPPCDADWRNWGWWRVPRLPEARWLRIKASAQVISELQATQSERFDEASAHDPYYGSLRHERGTGWLEVRADELASVTSQLRDDYDAVSGLGRDEHGRRDPASAAARNSVAMRAFAKRLAKLGQGLQKAEVGLSL
jgi:hypothetical protein